MSGLLQFLTHFTIFLNIIAILAELGASQNQEECKISRCGKHGPAIRFPFWLKHQKPDEYPFGHPLEFELSCTDRNDTVIRLPSSVELYVKKINYGFQQLHVYDPKECLLRKFLHLNLSASPFQFKQNYVVLYNYSLLNCSSRTGDLEVSISCLSLSGNRVYAVKSDSPIDKLPLSYCAKVGDVSSAPREIFDPKHLLRLSWSKPVSGNCTAEQGTGTALKSVITGATVTSFFLVVAAIGLLYRAYNINRLKKENQKKIERFLEDYRALKPTRYSYADIKTITNQFKNKLGQGANGTVFKGKLSNEILVAFKILNNYEGNGEEFLNEVGTIGRIHHVNVVRLVGFCADGYKRALIYEFLPNNSLEKFIFPSDSRNLSLEWEKLRDIALGIAKGIEYLHQGCDQRILHFDIKPHNILLDYNFNQKISDFGEAKLCSKERSMVSMTRARGTMGYIAPEMISRNIGHVSHKSDVYSFGMLLLEMVRGRKNFDVTGQVYFP